VKLSIVSTLFKSAPSIAEFYARATQAATDFAGDDYELVLVNDGSPDESLPVSLALLATDHHLVIVDLSRNFGHHQAIMTGLTHAKGDHVFLIDSDLEEEPEWLSEFAQAMGAKSCDVVYGVQEQRKGNTFERISGKLFYPSFKALTGINIPANIVTARLMTRRYVQALLCYKEREIFLAGLWYLTGFDQLALKVKKHFARRSTYTFRKKMALLVNSITSFSNAPLVSIFYIGASISMFACIYIAFLLVQWLFIAKTLSGWISVMASVWLLGGLIMSSIGVVGIYLAKVFSETKQRPLAIVRAIHRQPRQEC
jgi:putative glycosyltransferase